MSGLNVGRGPKVTGANVRRFLRREGADLHGIKISRSYLNRAAEEAQKQVPDDPGQAIALAADTTKVMANQYSAYWLVKGKKK